MIEIRNTVGGKNNEAKTRLVILYNVLFNYNFNYDPALYFHSLIFLIFTQLMLLKNLLV
jgi:hypothetical protein